jgi:Ca-activated chloride channel family protein
MQQLLNKFLSLIVPDSAKKNLRFPHFILLNRIIAVQVSDTTKAKKNYRSLQPKKYLFIFSSIIFLLICRHGFAQKVNSSIKAGNDAYKKGDYKNAEKFYKEALEEDNGNLFAQFNLGNALLKQNNVIEAAKYFSKASEAVSDNDFKAKAFYNKGLTMIKYQKLPEAIVAFKESLLLDPEDNDTRENLQKAIEELKKQQQKQPQQKPEHQKKPPQPKPQNKTASKDVMEQKFDELRDKEKQLQKLLQKKANDNQPDKDW